MDFCGALRLSPQLRPTMAACMLAGPIVTVPGVNFTGATASYFGLNVGVFVHCQQRRPRSRRPHRLVSGTVDVTVTLDPVGTSATSTADRFTYEVQAPIVTSISPASGPAAGGTSVTIACRPTYAAAYAVKFGSTLRALVHGQQCAISITAIAPAGSGTVDVTVTNSDGLTSATSAADRFTYMAWRQR